MTTLGLLSDCHGRADSAHLAVQLLIDHGAQVLINLGDIGSTGVIDALAAADPITGKQIESHLVFGNTDFDTASLGQYARDIGVHVHDPAGELEIDGKRVVFSHGHLMGLMQDLMQTEPDYLLQGHTHVPADTTRGRTRLINPGAMFRAPRHTVALLTPATGALELLEVASVAR